MLSLTPPFGEAAASVLAGTEDLLVGSAERFIELFYASLGSQPDAGVVLARLTPDELQRLKARQEEHLRTLLQPDLSREQALERGRRVGRVHSMVGVEVDWYAAAMADYQRGLLEIMDAGSPSPHEKAAMYAVISQRLAHDLQGVLTGYRDMFAGQNLAVMRVSQVVADADTVVDLARGVLEAVTALDGMAAAFFGRPDEEGIFQFEVGVGEGVEGFMADAAPRIGAPITTLKGDVSGQGPTGRSWHTQEIERCDAYQTDPTTRLWHELGRTFGWRSSAAVPLVDARGRSRAVVNLYASWPGYFSYSARMGFLTQLKQLMEPALARLERRSATAPTVSPYRTRVASLAHLKAGEVTMHYQPLVELPSGRLLKLEALARLRDGDRTVAPPEFLPALGDRELLSLFEFGIDHALRALAGWEARGVSTGVSLNLPTTCLTDTRYVAVVQKALDAYGVPAGRLTLELLESGVAGDDDHRHGMVLDQLSALGVQLAEDDLGSGYSSLLRLRNIAFDEIKIDQRLVRDTESSPREGLSFIGPLTNLAHSLGLTVVVEGLETDGLIEAAVMLGADAGQGYGIARPMEADAVPDWVRSYRLDVMPHEPRTPLGALAGHMAWEHRLATARSSAALLHRAATDPCLLTGFIERMGPRASRLEDAHRTLHGAAAGTPGGLEHRRAWKRLADMLGTTLMER